jgi:hypothetical protein
MNRAPNDRFEDVAALGEALSALATNGRQLPEAAGAMPDDRTELDSFRVAPSRVAARSGRARYQRLLGGGALLVTAAGIVAANASKPKPSPRAHRDLPEPSALSSVRDPYLVAPLTPPPGATPPTVHPSASASASRVALSHAHGGAKRGLAPTGARLPPTPVPNGSGEHHALGKDDAIDPFEVR